MNGRWTWGVVAGVMLGAAALAAAPAASADDACGTKENPCPLQKWMRQNMAPANASGDMAALGTLPPDQEPRATAHIAEMNDRYGSGGPGRVAP